MCNCIDLCIPDHLVSDGKSEVGNISNGEIFRRIKLTFLPVTLDNHKALFKPDTDSWNTSLFSSKGDVLLSEIHSNCEGPYFELNGYGIVKVNLELLFSVLERTNNIDIGVSLASIVAIVHLPTPCNYAHCEFTITKPEYKTKTTKMLIKKAIFDSLVDED